MTLLRLCVAAALITTPAVARAQDDALVVRVMDAVRSAMAPALPYPSSDELGSLPADGRSEASWMVRPVQPGERTLEILANPLNEAHQRRAAKAMAQIGASIEAAQRRAEAQYERAMADAKRTGQSQEVDGVTLSDEGLAGARIDAESHLTIDVLFNQPSYRFEVASAIAPAPPPHISIARATVLAIPANVFRDDQNTERLCEAETHVFLGRVSPPAVQKRSGAKYEVAATAVPAPASATVASMVIRLRGNEVVMADLLQKANWSRLLELLD